MYQEIINSTEKEAFTIKPELGKLFRELKSTLVQCHEECPLVFLAWLFVTLNLLNFGAFSARPHVNGCFFANIDACSISMNM